MVAIILLLGCLWLAGCVVTLCFKPLPDKIPKTYDRGRKVPLTL